MNYNIPAEVQLRTELLRQKKKAKRRRVRGETWEAVEQGRDGA